MVQYARFPRTYDPPAPSPCPPMHSPTPDKTKLLAILAVRAQLQVQINQLQALTDHCAAQGRLTRAAHYEDLARLTIADYVLLRTQRR